METLFRLVGGAADPRLAGLVLALGGAVAVNVVIRASRSRRAAAAARVDGEVLRAASGLPARIFVDADLAAAGLGAGGINRGRAHLVLAADRLVVATHHGRVLDIPAGGPGRARCVGPRRLVVEGPHPSGRARVRAELLVDGAEAWADAVDRALGPMSSP